MQGRKIDMMDLRFGRLLVIGTAPNDKRDQAMWECRCDCGQLTISRGSDLRRGSSHSCGCVHIENCRKRATKHGKTRTSEHNIWLTMRDRCRNPRNHKYESYGGRGISVCERWDDFTNFLADMGPKPPAHSIDRIDNDGNYEPSNCRWATSYQQVHNRRISRPAAEKAPA